jgi:hypothetical protein
MPLDNETLGSLKDTLGDAGAELYAKVAGSVANDTLEMDKLRAGHQSSTGKLSAFETQLATVTADRDKWKTDFEGANSDDAVQQLTAARDANKASSDDWKAKYDGLTGEIATQAKHGKIRTQLQAALVGDKEVPDNRLAAAMQLLGIPDGVDLDSEGQIIGHLEHVQKFQKDHGWMLEADGEKAKGNQGGKPGGDESAKAKAKATDGDGVDEDRARGREYAKKYFDSHHPGAATRKRAAQ